MSKTLFYKIHNFLKKSIGVLVLLSILINCHENTKKPVLENKTVNILSKPSAESGVSLIVLGTVQDAGSPHIACKKECCADLFENPNPNRKVVSLGFLDHDNKQTFLFDATPDISEQVKLLKRNASWDAEELPNGIFLTHAHIGHYSGLMYLGKEATNANAIPTYVMPKMKDFLEQNGPWSQLVFQKNIDLHPIDNKTVLSLTSNLKVIPLQVPHRDEFSETVGYKIIGPNKSILFIPDIDKWEKWETNITDVIKTVDYAFLDASFYDGDELNTRDVSQIPHPFVIESMALFEELPEPEKSKIYFIHFNHTNSLLDFDSKQSKTVLKNGFNIAKFNQIFNL
ncbi:MBL fold metallo-hydrolase [Maribacter algarum]|uniref:MBL fold metallo-hydrolase n=1 Tax=Maribacter algarum (ex Zhang et al. 2020) TaxID=2578118 RepID=A0A5S3PVS7_9FLAO|nr:MBL fold metallo-hydrolase [Maribacter algarum]TMM59008.1 MBL fold metallo-hydrolase [Maribacter algarum]